jgi:hypothetical protein
MDSERRTLKIVGALFVLATVASLLGSAILGSALEGADYLTAISGKETSVVVAALLFVTAATAAFSTAVLLFPILRRHAEGLAAGYVGLRTFENVFYVGGAIALLAMLSVSQDEAIGRAAAADASVLGATLLALHDWSVVMGTLIFAGLGALTLNDILYRATLVPRWLSVWGIAGAALLVLYGIIGLFGGGIGMEFPLMLLAMPIAVQEMVFAGWLIVKGFDGRGRVDTSSTHGGVEAPNALVTT